VGLITRAIRPASDPPDPPTPPAVTWEDPDPWPTPVGGPPFLQPWDGWPPGWQVPGNPVDVRVLTDTAWTCLDLNASILSTMPPYLVDAVDSLNATWLGNPNPDVYNDWSEFAKQLFWDFQMGEAFVLCTARYATGWPARFHVVPPWYVEVEIAGDGTRSYQVGSVDVTGDILHLRYRSIANWPRGVGPLEAQPTSAVAAQMWTDYASGLAASGGVPSGVLSVPEGLSASQATELQGQWIQARQNALGAPAVLSGGVTWQPTQLDPEKLALVDLQKFSESRVAIMLGVPPFLVGLPSGGDPMTYANVNAIFDYHWRAGLRPKAKAVMGGLSHWLLPAGTTIELNRDSYVQPDPYQRAQTWQIYMTTGVLSSDEVRRLERFDEMLATTTTSAIGAT